MEIEQELKTPSDEIIEKAKESESISGSNFMDPKIKKEKKETRGRPKKDKTQQNASEKIENKDQEPKFNIPTKVLCYPVCRAVSSFGVSFTNNPQAGMTPDEIEGLASSLGLVFDKYLPDAMSKYGPELALSFSLGQYGLRLYAIKKLMQEQAAKNNMQHARPINPDQKAPPKYQDQKRDAVSLVDMDAPSSIP